MASSVISRTAAPLRQQVVKLVREDILEGKLVPGQRLVESTLCDAYGVSRTVIREALRQLESEHLITVVPNLGPIVAVLSESEIRAIYVVRAALEGLAGKLFAENATKEQCKDLIELRRRLDKEYRKGDVDSREFIKADFYRQLADSARTRLADRGITAETHGGDFFADSLPQGADAISLVRILHDHNDQPVRRLLASVHAALPPGGTVVIAEPLSGPGEGRVGDAYFGFYMMAMGSGRPRSFAEIEALLKHAGFESVRRHGRGAFLAQTITATRS